MNILIISVSSEGRGGVSSVVAMQQMALKHHVQLLHLSPSHSADSSMFQKLRRWIKAIIQYPWLLLTKSIDLIHIHGSTHGSFPRKVPFMLISKLFRKKVIYHMHSGSPEAYIENANLGKRKAIKWLLNQYDGLVVLSHHWQRLLSSSVIFLSTLFLML